MRRKNKLSKFLAAALALVILGSGCHREGRKQTPAGARNLPPVILWAWERPEDLEFLDSQRFGVAFPERERRETALYILLKQPTLSPFVLGGLPVSETSEELDYYFESSWWCPPSDTDYNDEGNEVPKSIAKPGFLTAEQLTTAARERAALISIGDGKSYLGKQVIEWATTSPRDERIPEALFIAARANGQYKYGCNSWEFDHNTREKLERLLRENYPNSEWALKLGKPEE